jgi:hypothetical protein
MTCSFWNALSTWPIPKESGIQWAVGNRTTCNVQGFFTQMTIIGALYNGSLSVYYVLVTRYGWREHDFKKRPWVQALLHAIPMVWGIGTAIAGEFLTLFNNATLWCWIAPLPPDRGAKASLYRWAFYYGPLWTTIFFLTVNLSLTVLHLRKVTFEAEQKGQRPKHCHCGKKFHRGHIHQGGRRRW